MTTEKQKPPAIVWEGGDRPRIVPGQYTARCTGFQGPEWVRTFGRWGFRLEFALDPDEEIVSAFYSFGEDRNAPKMSTRYKYYSDWVRANGGPPLNSQEMSPEIFLNTDLSFIVHVSDATTDGENRVKDKTLVYSRIDRILEVKRLSTQEGRQPSTQAGMELTF
ncbi:MAG: hypothetical protein WCA21_06530 [Terracidiphilus sp.]